MQAGDEVAGAVTVSTGGLYTLDLGIQLRGEALIPRRWWFDARREIIDQRKPLMLDRRLGRGDHRVDFTLPLPDHLPASHVSAAISVRYALVAQLARGGIRGTIQERVPLIVREVLADSAGAPIRSTDEGIQLRAHSDLIGPGEVLEGELVVNAPVRAPLTIRVWLEARIRTRPGPVSLESQRTATTVTRRFRVERRGAGKTYRFQLPVPADAPISQSFDSFGVSWHLRAHALEVGKEIRVPIIVSGQARRGSALTTVSSPALRIWEETARSLGLTAAGKAVQGRIEGAEISLAEQVSPDGNLVLAGEVSYPSLGLHLKMGTDLPRGNARAGIDHLDRTHKAICREPAQLEVLGRLMPGILRDLAPLYMDDERLLIERLHAPGAVAELGDLLVRFARALPAVRAGVPPPAALAQQIDEWQALAAELRAPLCVADLSIDCEVNGIAARIETSWELSNDDARPAETWLSIFQEGLSDTDLWLNSPARYASLPLNDADRHALLGDARAMHISPTTITMHLIAPYPRPATLARRLRLLRQLAAQLLQTNRGPYR